MKWKYPNKEEYPQRIHGYEKHFPRIPCLVVYHRDYMVLNWNTHDDCWNDPLKMITFNKESITKWEYLDYIINTLDANELQSKLKD